MLNYERKKIFDIICEYYINLEEKKELWFLGFRKIINKYKKNNFYIPSKKEYNRLCENNFYIKNILKTIKSKPKFNIGDICNINSTIGNTSLTLSYFKVYNLKKNDLVIITNIINNKFVSNAKGCRLYKVMPINKQQFFLLEERNLQIYN